MAFYDEVATCHAGDSLQLPAWRIVHPDGTGKLESGLSTLTYTITNLATLEAVGTEDRNALAGANDVDIVKGLVYHLINPDETALTDADTCELFRVTYSAEFDDGSERKFMSDYLVLPLLH